MSSSSEKLLCASALLFITGSTNIAAQSTEAHVHGNAELNLVLMGQQLQVEFVSPAANLLGFERAPITHEESIALNEVIEQLQQGGWLIGDDLATCQLSVEAFEAPVYDGQEHDHDAEQNHDAEHVSGAHSDFRVQYLYDCQTTPAKQLQILAFDQYSGIETLTVQWIADQQQGYVQLNRENSLLNLE